MAELLNKLIAVGVWPEDLVQAKVVSSVKQVYAGRRRQKITNQTREVWIQPLATAEVGLTGFQEFEEHPFLLHVIVRDKNNAGPDGTGRDQLKTLVGGLLRKIKTRYSGERPFRKGSPVTPCIPSIVTCKAADETVDVDPTEPNEVEGTIMVTFYVTG